MCIDNGMIYLGIVTHHFWHDLPWDCYTSFFPNLYQSYGPLFKPKFRFHLISWELQDIFSPIFICALILILTRSSLGLLHVIFLKLVPELWSFIYAKILFPFKSWEPFGRISPNFIYAFILAGSSLELLHAIFCRFVPELWPLIYAEILFPLNILRTYWHIFTKFYICIHIDKI